MKRRVIITVAVLVVVLAAFVGIDRGVQALVERRIGTEVQTTLSTDQPPAVDLGPFPFLHEIATGRVDTARLRMAETEVPDGRGATATDVDATFTQITVTDGFSRVVAAEGRATGRLSYESLSTLVGLDTSYASPGRVSVAFSLPLGQRSFDGTATGRPVLDVDTQTLAFEDIEVAVPGAEGDEAVDEAAGRLVLRSVPLGELPYDLRLTEIDIAEDGVRVGLSGSELPLRG